MTRRRPANPVCIALDAPDPAACVRLAEEVAPHVGVLKIGLASFTAGGPELVRRVAALRPVFLDLKLHDIPAQVAAATHAARALEVAYLTVHAAGGAEMVAGAVQAAAGELDVLAVTVLTSLDETDLQATGVAGPASDQVVRLAELALGAGAPGLVCSPLEVAALRARLGPEPLLVVPGIRSASGDAGDQRRVATAAEALAAGADVIVVGRPVTAAGDSAGAARRLVVEAAGGPR